MKDKVVLGLDEWKSRPLFATFSFVRNVPHHVKWTLVSYVHPFVDKDAQDLFHLLQKRKGTPSLNRKNVMRVERSFSRPLFFFLLVKDIRLKGMCSPFALTPLPCCHS